MGCERVPDVSAAGCERVDASGSWMCAGGCERVLDASVAELLAGKHDGVMARWRNNGGWWLLVNRGSK